MNIQRFVLPATIAAALHVALLWFRPREEYNTVIAVPLVPLTEDPLPKPPEDLPPPSEERSADVAPVQSLAGGPAAPDLPDPEVTSKLDVLTVPMEKQAGTPVPGLTEIPGISGPGAGNLAGPNMSGSPVFPPSQLDGTPAAKVQLAPEYPFALKREGIAGTVVVEFDVDRTGQVTSAHVVRSSHREFEEPTLRAVRKWRFEPGRRNGQVVPFRMQVPVDFRVE